jgi:hypothetical protein
MTLNRYLTYLKSIDPAKRSRKRNADQMWTTLRKWK